MAYNSNVFMNQLKLKKIIAKTLYTLCFIVSIIYISAIIILIYIGPLETITVKKNIKNNAANIVVSLTTTKNRMYKMRSTLQSIIGQSIKPNKIYVNIPKQYVLSDWLIDLSNTNSSIIINKTNDYGPATKILAILEKEKDPNTIIVTLDDNKFYPKHAVRDLVKQYLPNTYKVNYKLNSAITGTGLNILFRPHFKLEKQFIIIGNRPSLNVVGVDGVAYKRGFFKEDIFAFMKNIPESCITTDDLMISAYLLANNISIVKITGISYNQVIQNLLLKNNVVVDYSEYGNCLSALSNYNRSADQKIMLQRSKIIFSLSQSETYLAYMYKKFYDYLNKFIQIIPFLQNIIVFFMK